MIARRTKRKTVARAIPRVMRVAPRRFDRRYPEPGAYSSGREEAKELSMSLTIQVLGNAGRDNALLVAVDSGQAVTKLLFDCGDGCLWQLPFGEVQTIDHLLFSHLHMDHIGGFDTFFRCTFNRSAKENHVWGPPQTATILQHRFRGFIWNLVGEQPATWRVHDLHADRIDTHRFELTEAFAHDHAAGERRY